MNYLENARQYFDKFRDSHIDDYREKMIGFKIHRNNGYQEFKGSDFVSQTMVNICANLEEVFDSTEIPGRFPSPRALLAQWTWFRDLMRKSAFKFDEIRNELFQEQRRTTNAEVEDLTFHLPEPFVQFNYVLHEVIEVMDHIFEMDEVKLLSLTEN